jgi:hypothetical protein
MIPMMRDPDPIRFAHDANKVLRITEANHICVAESHAALYTAITERFPNEPVAVINFDAHHDIEYNNPPKGVPKCDNWVRGLFNRGSLAGYMLVYPNWRKDFPEVKDQTFIYEKLPFNEMARVHVRHYDKGGEPVPLGPGGVDMVFVCRSGCWVPPCYDKLFNDFLWTLLLGNKHKRKLVMPERKIDRRGQAQRVRDLQAMYRSLNLQVAETL